MYTTAPVAWIHSPYSSTYSISLSEIFRCAIRRWACLVRVRPETKFTLCTLASLVCYIPTRSFVQRDGRRLCFVGEIYIMPYP
jgi:hypothetical protein